MGGGTKQRNRLKGRGVAGTATKYFTSSKSAEEVKDVLEDLDFDTNRRKKRVVLAHESKGSHAAKTEVVGDSRKPLPDSGIWSPTSYAAFKLLISAKFAAALWTTIADCDETYNYWEPTHYLLYGKGFQTWEYSPEYALRSYTYLLVHALPAKLYDVILHPNPLLLFFFIRCFLAFISASTEVFLYRSAKKYVGNGISCIALVTSLFSPGLFMSSTAYLPSAFSSYMTSLAIGAWLEGLNELAIFAIGLSALLSWPFAAFTGILIAFDIIVLQRKITLFFTWSIISLAAILIPIIVIDSTYFGKLVIAPLNIVKYNIFSTKGPDLYGTEPWTFYIYNGMLNFNLMFLISLIAPFFLISTSMTKDFVAAKEKWLILGTFLVWLGIFIQQPHKEERFLFPVYPLIPYCGAIGLESIEILVAKSIKFFSSKLQFLEKFLAKFNYGQLVAAIAIAWIILTSLIGCSRIVALYYGYRAPFDIFFNLHREAGFAKLEMEYPGREFNICYGKEWYRFPTSFFLPNNHWNVRFIQSEFKGQLPNLFPVGDLYGTLKIPDNMNDQNKEERTRYVNISECDFLVDSVTTDSSLEPNYAANENEWLVISDEEFLNSQKSNPFFRAFYIPFLSSEYTYYDRYVLLERRHKLKRRRIRNKPKPNRLPSNGRGYNDDLDDNLL